MLHGLQSAGQSTVQAGHIDVTSIQSACQDNGRPHPWTWCPNDLSNQGGTEKSSALDPFCQKSKEEFPAFRFGKAPETQPLAGLYLASMETSI